MKRFRNPVFLLGTGLMVLALGWATMNAARGRSVFGSSSYQRVKPLPGQRPLHHK